MGEIGLLKKHLDVKDAGSPLMLNTWPASIFSPAPMTEKRLSGARG